MKPQILNTFVPEKSFILEIRLNFKFSVENLNVDRFYCLLTEEKIIFFKFLFAFEY